MPSFPAKNTGGVKALDADCGGRVQPPPAAGIPAFRRLVLPLPLSSKVPGSRGCLLGEADHTQMGVGLYFGIRAEGCGVWGGTGNAVRRRLQRLRKNHTLSHSSHRESNTLPECKKEDEAMAASKEKYVKTSTGDFVFTKAHVHGSQNLYLKGKSIIMPGAIIRGELQAIRIGRYCVIGEGTVIRPAYRIEQEDSKLKCRFTPLSVGNHTFIGKNCIVESAGIGCNVRIEDGCVLGRNSFVRDNCHLLAGTVLPEGAVVPPFTVLAGCPAKMVSTRHESTASVWTEEAIDFYETFDPSSAGRDHNQLGFA